MEEQVKKVSEEKVWSFNGVNKYVQNTKGKMFQVDIRCQMCIVIFWQQCRLKKIRNGFKIFNGEGGNVEMLKIREAIYNEKVKILAYN